MLGEFGVDDPDMNRTGHVGLVLLPVRLYLMSTPPHRALRMSCRNRSVATMPCGSAVFGSAVSVGSSCFRDTIGE